MLCPLHERERLDRVQIAEQRVTDRNTVREVLEALLAEQPPVPWRRVIRVVVEMADVREDVRHNIAWHYFNHPRTI